MDEKGYPVILFQGPSSGGFDRIQTVLTLLDRINRQGWLVDIQSPTFTYKGFYLYSIHVPKDPATRGGIVVDLIFKEIKIVQSQLEDAPRVRQPRDKKPTTRPKNIRGDPTLAAHRDYVATHGTFEPLD